LLTGADVPAGYQDDTFTDYGPTSSSNSACMSTLNDLELHDDNSATVHQARAFFALSQSGPWLLEVLRSYPANNAAATFNSVTSLLSHCGTFTIHWPDGTSATETVAPSGSVGVGDQSWSAHTTVQETAFTTAENMVVARVGGTLVIVSEVGSPTSPPFGETSGVVSTAVAKLRGV
jgi:hypothetical protein